jgi:archaellum component FlaC
MGLTKEDLSEIRNIVREEVKEEVKKEVNNLRTEMNARFDAVYTRFDEQDAILNTTFTKIQKQFDSIHERLEKLETEVKSLRDDLSLTKSAVAPVLKKSHNKDVTKALAEIAKLENQIANLKKSLLAA